MKCKRKNAPIVTIIALFAINCCAAYGKDKEKPRKVKATYKYTCVITAWDGRAVYPMEMICVEKNGTKSKWAKKDQH